MSVFALSSLSFYEFFHLNSITLEISKTFPRTIKFSFTQKVKTPPSTEAWLQKFINKLRTDFEMMMPECLSQILGGFSDSSPPNFFRQLCEASEENRYIFRRLWKSFCQHSHKLNQPYGVASLLGLASFRLLTNEIWFRLGQGAALMMSIAINKS